MFGRTHAHALIFVLCLPILLLPISCSDETSPTDPGTVNNNTAGMQGVINLAGDYADPVPLETEGLPSSPAEETRPDGTLWICTEREIDIVTAPEELFLFNESGIIYPGALFQGKTLDQNPPAPINLPRGPGRIAIDLTTGEGETTFEDVPEVTAAVVENAINQLVADRTFTPARFVVRSENIRSEEELQVKMRLSGSGFGFSGAASFRFRSDRQYTRRLVTIEQVFFKARLERPTSAANWFTSSVTADDFKAYAGPGNPPVYVREMTYGRLVYILIEAEAEQTEIDAKVDATYKGLAGGVTVVAEEEYVGRLEGVQLQAVVYGGDTESSALAAAFSAQTAADFNAAIAEMVSTRQVPGGGLPLSYTVYEVKGNRAVRAKLATNYTLRDCSAILSALEDPLVYWSTDAQLCGTGAGGGDPVTEFTANRTEFEVLGQADLPGGADPWWNGNPCSQHTGCIGGTPCPAWTPDWQTGMFRTSGDCQANRLASNENLVSEVSNLLDPSSGLKLLQVNSDSAPTRIDYLDRSCVGRVIQFHDAPAHYLDTYPDAGWAKWGYPAKYARSELLFDGTALLANTDYTMFLVVQVPYKSYHKTVGCNCDGLNEATNPGGAVIYGAPGDATFQINISRSYVGVLHKGSWTGGNLGLDDSWHVYAIRFSQEKGISFFRDGVLLRSNAGVKSPITSFPNARLGSVTQGSVVRFRTAEVYGSAGSDQAIADQTTRIRSNLGI